MSRSSGTGWLFPGQPASRDPRSDIGRGQRLAESLGQRLAEPLGLGIIFSLEWHLLHSSIVGPRQPAGSEATGRSQAKMARS